MSPDIKNITSVDYKIGPFNVSDSFLNCSVPDKKSINYFIQVPFNYESRLSPFHTLIIDLNRDETELWDNIYHRTRTEINSFMNNTQHEFNVRFDLPINELTKFLDLFDSFAKAKRIRKAERERLNSYNQNGILAISTLLVSNTLVSVNFYRVAGTRASNLHSFNTMHLNSQKFNASLVGRANRAHHWLDIRYFKSIKIKEYDFCGWYEGKDDQLLLQINQFKEQFGGNKITEFTGVIYHNPVLKFLKFIRSVFKNGS